MKITTAPVPHSPSIASTPGRSSIGTPHAPKFITPAHLVETDGIEGSWQAPEFIETRVPQKPGLVSTTASCHIF